MRVVYICLLALIPLGEIHKIAINIHKEVDVFLFLDYKLHIQWVLKDIGTILQFVAISYVAYRLSCRVYGIGTIKHILKAVYVFGWIDLAFYFVNFKSGHYAHIYFVIAVLLLIFNHRKDNPK